MARSDRMHDTACCRSWRTPFLVIGLWLFAGLALAQEAPVAKATTSRAARQDAIRGIPFQALSREAGNRIRSVVRRPTMFRRMPISVIDCDPELHRFLVRYPEVVVNVWQLMGITKVAVERIAPYELNCVDGAGTTTSMELIYGDRDTHVIFCEGSYDGPLFRKPLHGRCLLVLKSGAVKTNSGRYQITNRLDVFIQIDHAGVDIFAKTLHPLLGKSADVNFLESMRFLQRMSRAVENNAPGMQHLGGRLQRVDDDVRGRFQQVVASVNTRHVQRLAQTATRQQRPGQKSRPRS